MMCISDYNFLQIRKKFDNILVSLFTTEVVPYVKRKTVAAVGPEINTSVDRSRALVVKLGIITIIVLPLLIIPLIFILRKRCELHERVFELFTSIDVEDV